MTRTIKRIVLSKLQQGLLAELGERGTARQPDPGGVVQPSLTLAIHQLEQHGLIAIDAQRYMRLTEEGKRYVVRNGG